MNEYNYTEERIKTSSVIITAFLLTIPFTIIMHFGAEIEDYVKSVTSNIVMALFLYFMITGEDKEPRPYGKTSGRKQRGWI